MKGIAKSTDTREEVKKESSSLVIFTSEEKNGDAIVFSDEKRVSEYNLDKQGKKEPDFSAFYELAALLDMSVEETLDRCCMFQVRNLMGRLGKVIIRYNVTSDEISKILHNTNLLKTSEVLISPAYLPTCKKIIEKRPEINQNTGIIVDFPFGESSFKSKFLNVKESVKAGVDSVTVMLPTMLFEKNMQKELKKQARKIGKVRGVERGIALSVMDIEKENVKSAIKIIEKTKVNFITLVFGNVTEIELKERIKAVLSGKNKKKIKVLANVDTCKGVTELIKLKVDTILTPYADDIGKELLQRFKIQSVKLK